MEHKNSEEALEIRNVLKKYYDRWINGGRKLYYLDDACSGMALIDLHQITGEEKYRQAACEITEYLYFHEKDVMGSLSYRPKQGNNYKARSHADSKLYKFWYGWKNRTAVPRLSV